MVRCTYARECKDYNDCCKKKAERTRKMHILINKGIEKRMVEKRRDRSQVKKSNPNEEE